MLFHIVTIFPKAFSSYLKESIIGRAIKNKLINIKFYNPRDFVKANKSNYKPVDDKPYGGGPGMVMRAEPILEAVASAMNSIKEKPAFALVTEALVKGGKASAGKAKIIILSPAGKKFETSYAKKLIKQKYTDIILICGRYEGIDARVKKILKAQEISIGDYVLTGGELPAMVLMDSLSRQIPGVLGKYESLEEERISTSEVYTRPEVIKFKVHPVRENVMRNVCIVQSKKNSRLSTSRTDLRKRLKAFPFSNGIKNYRVPKVLLSGDHKKIELWKQRKKFSTN